MVSGPGKTVMLSNGQDINNSKYPIHPLIESNDIVSIGQVIFLRTSLL